MPISIRIAYDWSDGASNKIVWPTIKRRFTEVLKRLEQNHGNDHFSFYVGRMRAAHASDLCASIVERCKTTDIVAFDISTYNPNVLFELGVALGTKGAASGEVFLFARANAPPVKQRLPRSVQDSEFDRTLPIPADLAGYLQTRYRLDTTKPSPKMILDDFNGFRAAVVSKVMEIARKRGMLIDQRGLGD